MDQLLGYGLNAARRQSKHEVYEETVRKHCMLLSIAFLYK